MQRIATTTAVTSRPTPDSTGTPGYFTEGNAAAGTPATVVSGDWLNDVQETLLAPIEATGQTATVGQNDQLLVAIRKLALIAPYDAALAAAIGGYPLNAVVAGASAGEFYVSTVADNLTVPGGADASWNLLPQTGDIAFYPFSDDVGSGSSATVTVSFTPTRSGQLKVDLNGGTSTSTSTATMTLETSGSGFTPLGGAVNHSDTNLLTSNQLYSVTAGTPVVLTYTLTFTGPVENIVFGGIATFVASK